MTTSTHIRTATHDIHVMYLYRVCGDRDDALSSELPRLTPALLLLLLPSVLRGARRPVALTAADAEEKHGQRLLLLVVEGLLLLRQRMYCRMRRTTTPKATIRRQRLLSLFSLQMARINR